MGALLGCTVEGRADFFEALVNFVGEILCRIKGSTDLKHGEWLKWCEENIERSQRDIQRLMKMAGSDDPEAALEQERADSREGMRARRAALGARAPRRRSWRLAVSTVSRQQP